MKPGSADKLFKNDLDATAVRLAADAAYWIISADLLQLRITDCSTIAALAAISLVVTADV